MPNVCVLVRSGYPPRNRLCLNGDVSKYELYEVKFWSYMHIQKLHKVILAPFWSSHWQRLLWKECRCICWMNSISWWSKFAIIMRKNPWWWENINCTSVSLQISNGTCVTIYMYSYSAEWDIHWTNHNTLLAILHGYSNWPTAMQPPHKTGINILSHFFFHFE